MCQLGVPKGKAFGESTFGLRLGARVRIPVWIFVVRLLRDRLFVGPGISAATDRALSSSRETLSHHGSASGLPVLTASLMATLVPGL